MRSPFRFPRPAAAVFAGCTLALTSTLCGQNFRAGAAAADISPQQYPVRVNAMFTERSADRVVDSLTAKALALDDGKMKIVLCVVDTCMMGRDLIDTAKKQASQATGIPVEKMLVSATHTHSAPSAMGCLGSRVDPAYAALLPGRIAEAIAAAVKNLQPAQIGWAQTDDWEHTHNRRWIRRPDKILTDPFGVPNVRANMHPGHQSPDVTGPSGPVDPQLSLLALRRPDGAPLAALANYSMHYCGSPLLSADYFGRFAVHLAAALGAGPEFTGIMSQGTSGDLMWMDYGAAKREIGYDAYAREIAAKAAAAWKQVVWKNAADLGMVETALALNYRVPDEKRLARAREMTAKLGDRLPQTHPEIYAQEAIHLHERQKAELKIQALRIGDLGITGLPNEVFALSGLKIKQQSPFAATFNIELANGAEGYIPPPEQHALGGYTTWPARTAGLETAAEPKIVETAVHLLEQAAGKPRREVKSLTTPYSAAVTAAKPTLFLTFDAMSLGAASGIEDGVALYLPGFDEGSPPASRAFHFAGGRVKTAVPLGASYSVEFWLWNGLPADARAVTGYAFSRGPDGDKAARGEHLGIGGTFRPDITGRLILFNGNERDEVLAGKTILALQQWHHVAFVREGENVRVHLDGKAAPEISGRLPHTVPGGISDVFFGGRSDGLFNWEGKLDEAAIFDRALTPEEITAHHAASGRTPPKTSVGPEALVSPPLTPQQAIQSIHVPNGFAVELVAHEPQTVDPIAIDWDLAGRLWVVEMADYPLGMDNQGKPGGRVRMLEDRDADGHYEQSTLFADGLNFPTGLLTWRDGVLVIAAPEILLLRDTNGDGRADSREVLVTGLTEGNQQLRANGLRWGLDNWVYCAAGGHHGEYGKNTKLHSHRAKLEVALGSRDFRFRPDTGELEPESGPSQFGRNRDDWNHWFGTQNSRALWHYVLPDRQSHRNPFVPSPDPTHQVVTPLNAPVWPVSPPEKRFHSFENRGHFTSACGGMIYRDSLLFPRRDGELDAFTCEPFHNLVQHNIVVEDGVSYAARRDPAEHGIDFFASEDRWCRPVMTRTGPDGALWVVDMYRYMIEHPDWLPENGRAELLPHYRAGDDKGRIYRVFPALKEPVSRWKPMDRMGAAELMAQLESSNEWQRDKAHMAILWKANDADPGRAAVGALAAQALGACRNPLAKVHLLAVVEELKGLDAVELAGLFQDPHPKVREFALQFAEKHGEMAVISSAERLTQDPDIKVRLNLALALGNWPVTSPEAAAKIGGMMAALAVKDFGDPTLRAALLSSPPQHFPCFLDALRKTGNTEALTAFTPEFIRFAVKAGQASILADCMAVYLIAADGGFSEFQLSNLARSLQMLGQNDRTLVTTWLQRAEAAFRFAKQCAGDAKAAMGLRSAGVRLLLLHPEHRPWAVQQAESWLEASQPTDLQSAAIKVLAETGDSATAPLLLTKIPSLSPAVRTAAVDVLLSREAWAMKLLQAVEAGAPVQLDAGQKSNLLHHGAPSIRNLAAKLLGGSAARKQVVEQFLPAAKLTGDAEKGRTHFQSRCAVCHRHGDTGNEVGPNLLSVASHPAEKILTNIIDPSIDVQPGFYAYQCKLNSGEDLFGLVTSETGNSVTFKLVDGSSHLVARSDMASLKSAGISLMPEGLEAGLTAQDMADLIAFIRTAGGKKSETAAPGAADLNVGAAAVNLRCDPDMPLAGYLDSRFTAEQEGELRVTAVVLEKPGAEMLAIVQCDVLWLTRASVDSAVSEIEKTIGIPAANILVNATHTHHAPGTAPAHAFGASEKFVEEVRRGIVKSVTDAHKRRAAAGLYFQMGEEHTVGANSRLLLKDGCISWLNPAGEAGLTVRPTGPFDPQLPVLDFRDAQGSSVAVIFNHSTHPIGTRSGREVRSPGFYGLAAQEMERECGGIYNFLEGASGSTHNVRGIPVPEAIERIKAAVGKARAQAAPLAVARISAAKRPFVFKVRLFDESDEAEKIRKYARTHAAANADKIEQIFTAARERLRPEMGQERTTWLQVLAVGDVAMVGVPGEYFTALGMDIKRRSPFPHTIIAELANDWIGYLPDSQGNNLGGYQTWMGLHCFAEAKTGERIADEAVAMLQELRQRK
ncbi:MAG: c-type cytochrome [Verrucomicrobiales bacterium]|nr:c-type cytochrome [Verrucomicrobiales bacterium]